MDKLFIIDLMPFLYKGHFVFLRNPRMTASGINTSALLGLASGLQSILKKEKPTHAVLAMDPGGPTFRHEAYAPYKAQRQKMPEDLAASIPYAFELAEALKIPVVRVEGFEADDVMGTLAVKGAAAGFDVYVKASVFRGMIGSYFELKHVCEMLSIPVVPSPIIIPSQCGEDRGELVITDEDYRELLRGMQSDCPEATCSVKRKSIDSPLCHAGLTTICVDPYGNVFPCNSYRKLCGNVRSDRIEDIWNDSPVLKSVRGKSFRDLSKRCDGCVDFDFCTVCAGVTYPLFGEVRRCDYLCSQAHVRHEIFGRKGGENDETV